MFTLFAKLLKVLNSEAEPWQIGWAIALGLLAGILPFGILTLLVVLIVCLLTINLTTFIVVWAVSGGLMLWLGGPLEAFTWQYAQNPALLKILSGSEVLQMLHLHHTLVLGAFLLGLILLLPVAWLSTRLVKQYRTRVMSTVEKWKVVQVLKASKVYQLYNALS